MLIVGLERENGEELEGQKKRLYSAFLDRDFGPRSVEDGGDIHNSSRSITTVKRKHRKANFRGNKP